MDFTMTEVKEFKGLKKRLPLWKKLLIVIITVVVGFMAAVISGLIVSLSANASVSGIRIVFDPLITLGYLAVSYLVAYFHELNKSQQYKLFLFSLILSFTINFIQGVMTLVILLPVLKKLKLA